jgi:hypothetical protein
MLNPTAWVRLNFTHAINSYDAGDTDADSRSELEGQDGILLGRLQCTLYCLDLLPIARTYRPILCRARHCEQPFQSHLLHEDRLTSFSYSRTRPPLESSRKGLSTRSRRTGQGSRKSGRCLQGTSRGLSGVFERSGVDRDTMVMRIRSYKAKELRLHGYSLCFSSFLSPIFSPQ